MLGADGKLDLTASSQKLAEGYTHAAKRIGSGDLPPAKPEDYKLTLPETLKDMPVDEEATNSFRAEAHKAGLTQSQFDLVMGRYYDMVPSLLNSAAKVSADEARGQLQAVWQSKPEFEANMNDAQRAFQAAPPALHDRLHEKFGTDPDFIQFAAAMGKSFREDRPPSGAATAPAQDPETLMSSEAYRNPKHPQHAMVSAQVKAIYDKRYGTNAPMQ